MWQKFHQLSQLFVASLQFSDLQFLLKATEFREGVFLGKISMKKFQEQYIVDEKGQRTAVVLPVEEYEELLEDLNDLAIIAERRDEPTIAFEELKKRLMEDGLL